MDSSERDWSWLLEEILNSILDNLVSVFDHARFSLVCKHWSSVAKQYRRRQFMKLLNRQLPLLLIPSKHNQRYERNLYSVTDDKIYDLHLPLKDNSRRYCGSSHGWLATVDKNMIITLRNPFLNQTRLLPPIMESWKTSYMHEFDVSRVVLYNNPSLSTSDNINYNVVAISGVNRTLEILKSGSETWTYVDKTLDFFQDIVYYNDMLLAVDLFGRLVCIDAENSNCLVIVAREETMITHLSRCLGSSVYLVKSSEGKLMMIRRIMKEVGAYKYITQRFRVYQLLQSSKYGKGEWVEMKSMGDDAVFVGDNETVCVPAADFPGCKPNSIYFIGNNVKYCGRMYYFQPYEVGSFNLEDGSISRHYLYDQCTKPLPPSIWIVPTLRGDQL
ncbi:F-box protein At2g26160-like [Tripterygium wilfordii]|uniref:F-box protein At2g26160-like n=1 Tax=Tripterygium wilfordii TaxID=458696 RepID=UPI0018F84024|nr:F-box protein At2g26160-like [Tripterygium wilfordii]